MSKAGVTYDGGGNITGFVFCSQDGDLELQTASHVEVAASHASVTAPAGWEVITVNGVPTVHVR